MQFYLFGFANPQGSSVERHCVSTFTNKYALLSWAYGRATVHCSSWAFVSLADETLKTESNSEHDPQPMEAT